LYTRRNIMTDTITVNLEDLETLIFAAGAMKPIEIAMDTRKRDPFVLKELPITAAINRLATEARSARRSKETYATPWDGELNDDEQAWLAAVCDPYNPNEKGRRRAPFDIIPEDHLGEEAIHTLNAKGMLVIGTSVRGVVWPGAEQAEIWPEANTRFYLMPTTRGLRKWRELQAAKIKTEEEKPNE
jgi:hypothetical protein